MGIGSFEKLLMRGEDQLVVINAMTSSMTGFYIGKRPSRQGDVEQAFRRVGLSLQETNGETR